MKFFNLFSNCLPIRGASRSLIADLHRSRLQFIPNELCEMFLEKPAQEYSSNTDKTVMEYFDFLLEEEYGFLCEESEIEFFPKLKMDFKMPNEVYNAIIDFGEKKLDNHKIASQLDEISCSWIQLRFFRSVSILEIKKVLEIYSSTNKALSIDLIIPFDIEFQEEILKGIANKYINLHRISVYSSPMENVIDEQSCNIIYSKNNVGSSKYCGAIRTDFFSLNIKAISEATHHNSCLHGKISIDMEGNIKNCPSMSESYGNIEKDTLKNALEHNEFKKHWNITKDQISVCKDCEFRYICTDCRAYLENPNDIKSKPLKCGYNPYTNEWEDWSKNPLKKEAINYYKLKETVNNQTEIWS